MNSNSTTIETSDLEFRNHLETLSEKTDIAGHVAREALEHDDVKAFFHDLSCHGCESGIVRSLIYYTDTHAFFDTHYDEIQREKNEWETGCDEPLRIE